MDRDDRFEWLISTTAARVKIATARSDQLVDEIRRWRSDDPLATSLVVKDAPAQGWFIRVDSVKTPDLDQWGVQLGEIAHHLRSILNTTLTRIVLREGGTPSSALQYPIAMTADAWRKNRKRLRGLPDRVQRAVYASQPFLWARDTGGFAANHVLAVLGWLDNEDKHRLEITGHLGANWIEHMGRVVTPDGVVRRANPNLTYDWSLRPGSYLVDADASPLVIEHVDFATLDLELDVRIADELGTTTPMEKLLGEIWDAYRDALFAVVAAWADEQFDLTKLAGSSDFHQGAAFGKAAVDTAAGQGFWDNDYSRRRKGAPQPPYRAFDPPSLPEPGGTPEGRVPPIDWETIRRLK